MILGRRRAGCVYGGHGGRRMDGRWRMPRSEHGHGGRSMDGRWGIPRQSMGMVESNSAALIHAHGASIKHSAAGRVLLAVRVSRLSGK